MLNQASPDQHDTKKVMITIVHGEDLARSRNFFQELKKQYNSPIVLEGGKATITDFAQNIRGFALFSETKTIFIENLFSKTKKTDKDTKEILNLILENSKDSNFIFWESKEISTPKTSGFFKNAQIKNFKLPKNIFLFLDAINPGNSINLVKLFHQALQSGIEEEVILFMMQRQIRLLLALKEPAENTQIDEASRLAPWQMDKLERQARLFDIECLKKTHRKLFETELGQKTGTLKLSLSQTIDFL